MYIRQKEKKPNSLFIILLILFGIILFGFHFFTQSGLHDDSVYATYLDTYGFFGYLSMRYHTWSSRLLVEGIFIILAKQSFILWMILDTLAAVLLIYSLFTFANLKWDNWFCLICLFLMLFLLPVEMLNSAGWMATSLNYFWCLSLGIYAMIPIQKIFTNQKLTFPEILPYLLAALFAANQEQMAALLFGAYTLTFLLCFYQKRSVHDFKPGYFMWGLTSLELLFTLTCPGNAIRSVQETEKWFPEFANYSFLEKLHMGFLSTISYYISGYNFHMIFIAFTGILAIGIWMKNKKALPRFFGILVFLASVLFGFVAQLIDALKLTSRTYWLKLPHNDKLGDLSIYTKGQVGLETAALVLLTIFIFIEIYWIFGKTEQFLFVSVCLVAGLLSRFILGFSPTIYASLTRTFIYCTFSLFLVMIFIINSILEVKPKLGKVLVFGLFVVCITLTILYCNLDLLGTHPSF